MHSSKTTFTITTFWLDWLLVPFVIIGAYFILKWAKKDFRHKRDSSDIFPSLFYSFPLIFIAIGWLITGFAMLIKEDYWEMKVFSFVFLMWTIGCIIGTLLLIPKIFRKTRGGNKPLFEIGSIGLLSLLMLTPLIIPDNLFAIIDYFSHIWFLFLILSTLLSLKVMLIRSPYMFSRFPFVLGNFFLIGWGISEITFQQNSFPWLIRIWKPELNLEYLDNFPHSQVWIIFGTLKLLISLAILITYIIKKKKLSK